MKILIVYDSLYGNTEKVAQAIGEVLAERGDVQLVRVGDLKPDQMGGIDLLVIGSPTQQFRATEKMRLWLDGLPSNGLRGMRAAAFDTRLTLDFINKHRVLAFFQNRAGYAAEKIASTLIKKGAQLVVPGQAFYVVGSEGPLVEGELERGRRWAGKLFA